jgi:SWI/SNF-related matrix-associated actin-dependent regulator of chromatin subfamily A3
MSAKKRQETLERFSIPLEDDLNCETASGMPSRSRRSSTQVSSHGDSFDIDDDGDADFTLNDVSDGDFLDDDDDSAFSYKPRKGKGNSKGKAKAKSTARTSVRAAFNGSSFAGENPKVMLISLKAGALGLNLTVANNVYL